MNTPALTEPMPKQQQPLPILPRTKPSKTHAAERVVLTGFMGSGKSTAGRKLAQRLGWSFTDLDTVIERRSGMTIAEVFARFGEAHFRKLEASALATVLGQKHTVIALGGGAPEILANRLLLEQTPATMVVFLHAPFDLLHSRCTQPGAAVRPLLADRTQAESRYTARQRAYEQIATVRLDTSNSSADEVSAAIARLLRPAI